MPRVQYLREQMGFRTNGNLDQNRKQAFCHENGNSNKWESWTGKTKNEAPSPLPQLSQARLASANCVRVVCGCCSAFAEHFSKQCLLGLKFETKQNSQTWFWEMYRRGRVATAHHAEAVGEQQANLGKRGGASFFVFPERVKLMLHFSSLYWYNFACKLHLLCV